MKNMANTMEMAIQECHFGEDIELQEVQEENGQKSAKITILRPGWSKNGVYWDKEITASVAEKINEGRDKMYVDHVVADRPSGPLPPRSVLDWVASVKAWVEPDGVVKGQAYFIDDALGNAMFKRAQASVADGESFSGLGVSVDLFAKVEPKEEGDQRGIAIREILKYRSTDFVDYPAAGGGIDNVKASESWSPEASWTTSGVSRIRERLELQNSENEGGAKMTRQEVYEWLTSTEEGKTLAQELVASATTAQEVTEKISKLEEDNKSLQERAEDAEKAVKELESVQALHERKEFVVAQLKEAKIDTDLPKIIMESLWDLSRDEVAVKAAVKEQAKFLQSLKTEKSDNDKGKVEGMGVSENEKEETQKRAGLLSTEAALDILQAD